MTAEALLVETVLRIVREEFADRIGRGHVLTRETRLQEDLGADEAERDFLGYALEEETGLGLEPYATRTWRTVGDVIDSCLAQLG